MTSPSVAVAALVLAAALALGVAAAPVALLGAVLLAQGLVVAGWHRSLAVPGARGGRVVGALAAVASDALVLTGTGQRPLSAVPAVLACAVLAALVHQLARRDGRERLTASLTATVSLAVLVVLGAAFLAVPTGEDGRALVSAAAAAAALAVAGGVVRRRTGAPRRADIAVVAGAGALSAAVIVALDALPPVPALAVAASAAGLSWVATLLVSRSAAPDAVLAAGLPLVLAGPVAFVLGRLLVG